MNRSRIVLIGAGQFGSRHLQALALCESSLELYLVDPSTEAREIARERFESIEGFERHQITYSSELESLPNALDVVIVATSAVYRRNIIEALMPNRCIGHLILEKVLFQSAQDCRDVRDFLGNYQTKIWVNAPRRMWQLFKKLNAALQGREIKQISLSVAGWGMACNAYHMLDLFSWLAGSPVKDLSTRYLDPDPIPARRNGFFELTGMLTGQLVSGVRFSITDHREGRLPFKLMIETTESCFVVQEGKAAVTILDGEAPDIARLSGIGEQYQSQLTNELVETLLDSGTCALPGFDEAATLHEIMLTAFAEVFNRNGLGEDGLCPIT